MITKTVLSSLFDLPFILGTHENVVTWIVQQTRKRSGLSLIPGTLHEVAQAKLNSPTPKCDIHTVIYTTDGMPLVWLAQWFGFKDAQRVYGPDLFVSVLKKTDSPLFTHALYGGTQKTLAKVAAAIKLHAPRAHIVYAHAPDFTEHPQRNSTQLKKIQAAQPHFLWVGVGGAKQVRLLAEWQQKLPETTCIGIGAAFDFISGAKAQAPLWMQRSGLEWLFRLCTEPHRLWKRYLVTIPHGLLRAFFSSAPSAKSTTTCAVVLKYGNEASVCDYVDQTTRVLAQRYPTIQLSIPGYTTWGDTLSCIRTVCAVTLIGPPRVLHLSAPRILPLRSWWLMKRCDTVCAQMCINWLVHYCSGQKTRRIIWNFYPQLADWCLGLKRPGDAVVFDVVDIYTPIHTADKNKLTVQIKALIQKATVVTAISRTAQTALRKNNPGTSIHLVPQGFDSTAVPPYSDGSKIFTAGYIGALNGRIAVKELLSCVRHMPGDMFLFIGPLSTDENVPTTQLDLLQVLLKEPNVTWLPTVPRSTALSCMQLCRIGIIPYDHQLPFNRTSYPMKVLEYFALGLPVVSTPLPELMRHKQHIRFVTTVDEWVSTLRALKKVRPSTTDHQMKKKIAYAQTWEKKIGTILQLLNKGV